MHYAMLDLTVMRTVLLSMMVLLVTYHPFPRLSSLVAEQMFLRYLQGTAYA